MREETPFDRWVIKSIGTGTRSLVVTYSFLAMAQVIFGGSSVIGKIGVNAIPPVIFAMLRSAFSMVIMVTIMLFIARQRIQEKKDIFWFMFFGFTGIYSNQFMFTMGLAYAGPLLASIMQPVNPILTTFLAIVLRKEPPSAFKILGILLAVAGTLVMIEIEKISLTSDKSLGLTFLLVQSIGNAIYLIWAKPFFARYAPIFVVSMAHIFGAAFMFVTFVIYAAAGGEMSFSMKSAWPIAYTVIFQSIVAYILTAFATRSTDVSVVAASNTLQPVVAAVLTWMVFGDVITWREGLGMSLILAGLFAVCYQKYRDNKTEALKKAIEGDVPIFTKTTELIDADVSIGNIVNTSSSTREEKQNFIIQDDNNVIELEDSADSLSSDSNGPRDIVNSRV